MADEKNWERRILQSMGSNFRLDVNNPQTSVGGDDVYNFYAENNEGKTNLMGFQQNGFFRIYNDSSIEIVGGQTSESAGVDITIVGKNGDVVINAEKNGRVRVRGKNVTIQADEDVDIMAGRNINLQSGSGRVLVRGNTLEKTGLKGNLLEPEKQWAYRVFDGTGLPAFAFSALVSPFSGITDLAGNLLDNPNLFGNLVQGAVETATSAATGGFRGGGGGSSSGGGVNFVEE